MANVSCVLEIDFVFLKNDTKKEKSYLSEVLFLELLEQKSISRFL